LPSKSVKNDNMIKKLVFSKMQYGYQKTQNLMLIFGYCYKT
jgi:hypothetical protein